MMSRFSIEAVFKATDRFSAPLSKFQNRVSKATRAAKNGFRSLNTAVDKSITKINGLAKSAGRLALVGFAAVTGSVTLLLREFSKIEDAVAAFTPLLGGAQNAQKAVDLLNKTAASTPFQFEQLSAAANTLLGFGAATLDTLIPTIRMLGDTAGGSSDKLGRIALAFSKIKAAGKADMQDLNQLIDAGIPIFAELEAITGKNTAQLRKMSSQGKISAKLINQAFIGMTKEGGKFFNGMDIASKTLTGRLSTLKDNLSLTAAEIGSVLAPIVKEYVDQATIAAKSMRDWVTANKALISQKVQDTVKFVTENFKSFAQTIKGLIQLYAGLIAVNLALKTVTIAATVATVAWNFVLGVSNALMGKDIVLKNMSKAATIGWIAATAAAKVALIAFNGIMLVARTAAIGFSLALSVNPIGAIVIAVGLLITALALLILNFDKIKLAATDAMESIANTISGVVQKIKAPLALITAPFRNIFEGVSGLAGAFGFGGDAGGGAENVVTPEQRITSSIEERVEKSKSELVIKDETGRAELSGQTQAPGSDIQLIDTGTF